MASEKLKSISINELNVKLESAIKDSLSKRDFTSNIPDKFGILNNPGVLVGYTMSDDAIDGLNVNELNKLAQDISSQFSSHQIGKSAAIIHNGGATVGFFPAVDILELKL